MRENKPLDHLIDVLGALVKWLRESHVSGVIVGGVAASLLGRPRLTRDIDALILVEEPQWNKFLAEGKKYGFVPRLKDCLSFARKSKVLLLRHQPTKIDVDLILGILPFEHEIVQRTILTKVKGIVIPLPTPEDLIIMKAIAHRPRDIADIESILDANPKLDKNRILTFVREFAQMLEIPEIYDDIQNIFQQKRSKSR